MSEFQSTLPGWGATPPLAPSAQVFLVFQSTLPGWGATSVWSVIVDLLHISIHTPRMGSDSQSASDPKALRKYFNPRSPDGERPDTLSNFPFSSIFQSTLPGWGATRVSMWCRSCRTNFNPRSPDGERRRMELTKRRRTSYFNPRSPDGERLQSDFQTRPNTYFNPRSPDGERQFVVSNISSHWKFQSTLPGWGATNRRYCSVSRMANFNPRSPDGERLHLIVDLRHRFGISIHAPRMGSDGLSHPDQVVVLKFQSTLPGWGATLGHHGPLHQQPNFNPRSPDGERPRKWTSSPTIWAKSSIFNTDCIADRR